MFMGTMRGWIGVGLSAVLGFVAWAPRADAQQLSVTLGGNAQQLAETLNISISEIEQQITDNLEEAFNLVDTAGYLGLLADAEAFSNRGLGADYSTGFKHFIVGGAFSGALGLGQGGLSGFSLSEIDPSQPIAAPAVNASLMAGLNFGFIGMKKLNVFINYFSFGTSVQNFNAKISSFGIHGQYRFFKPKFQPLALLFKWGGVSVTSGIATSSLTLSIADDFNTTSTVNGTGPLSSEVTFAATGDLTIDASAFTIPLEVSTSARLLYVLELFAGVGIDIQAGSGKLDANLNGDLSGTNPIGGADIDMGNAAINASSSGKPTALQPRLMGGAQVNLWLMKIFAQANYMPGRVISFATGLRFAL